MVSFGIHGVNNMIYCGLMRGLLNPLFDSFIDSFDDLLNLLEGRPFAMWCVMTCRNRSKVTFFLWMGFIIMLLIGQMGLPHWAISRFTHLNGDWQPQLPGVQQSFPSGSPPTSSLLTFLMGFFHVDPPFVADDPLPLAIFFFYEAPSPCHSLILNLCCHGLRSPPT